MRLVSPIAGAAVAYVRPSTHDTQLGCEAGNNAEGAVKSDYRPDIDGLRAIAVVAVILFHFEVPGFPGGFVGVDIFFVISGYLITRLLVAEGGELSLIEFYAR
ncbi:acyltransferase, partial [Mesorhizobium sp. M2D.F.Ca.ET.145.01.1.1]